MWAPQPGPQTEAICADWCPELFYGGAAGGGKSDFLLGDYLQDVPTYGQAWKGILFRRTYPELEELIARAHEIYSSSGGAWNEQKKTWTWPNGANLKMRFLEADRDATRYQGHQYTWVGWDELTQWPSLFPYRYLRARLRSAHSVPTKRIRAAANPGGLGHMAVKQYFIDPAPGGFVPIKDPDTGLQRMFIPSRIRDNAVLLRNDPDYIARLKGLGSDAMVKAWLEGDWNVVDGAFFDCWHSARHVVSPFSIPDNWLRFRSFDWGSARPFSVGWWAVVTDDYQTSDGRILPRGALVRYREWYGAKGPNEGLKLTAEEVAEGIVAREAGETIAYGVADPSIFAQNGGPSLAERMMPFKCYWKPGDNRRVGQSGAQGGWDQMRERLKGDDEIPMLYVFNTCKDFIRTVPAMQHDPAKPEDIDTNGEDHCADESRYACMSRPWIKPKPDAKKHTPQFYGAPDGTIKSGATLDELWKPAKRGGNARI